MPSQFGCGKFGGHSQKTSLNPLASKAQKQNFDLTPGFRVVNLAAKLKRQISHAKFTAHQIPPPPPR